MALTDKLLRCSKPIAFLLFITLILASANLYVQVQKAKQLKKRITAAQEELKRLNGEIEKLKKEKRSFPAYYGEFSEKELPGLLLPDFPEVVKKRVKVVTAQKKRGEQNYELWKVVLDVEGNPPVLSGILKHLPSYFIISKVEKARGTPGRVEGLVIVKKKQK